ncbi:MAG: glycerol-3-phosphate acyltransferase, partial [Opitutaceae bacterium]
MSPVTLIAVVAGYLLGALPFGYLVAKAKGVDIFSVGSRNPGATNVRRVLGHGPGNLVLFLDAAKGAAAA